MVRESLVEVCEGDHCAAAVLNLFVYWTTCRRADGQDDQITRSKEQIHGAIVGLFSKTKICEAVAYLTTRNLLSVGRAEGLRNIYTLEIEHLQAQLGTHPNLNGYPTESERVAIQNRTGTRSDLDAPKEEEPLEELLESNSTASTPTLTDTNRERMATLNASKEQARADKEARKADPYRRHKIRMPGPMIERPQYVPAAPKESKDAGFKRALARFEAMP